MSDGIPTLLKKGTLLPQKWMSTSQKENLKSKIAIENIIEYLEDRTYLQGMYKIIPVTFGHKVLVLKSGTATGKSTIIPPYIYNKFYVEYNIQRSIICTQPTISTTIDIPYQIATYNKNIELDVNIGYQTGNLIRKPVKGILFATIGILLQQLKILKDEIIMKKYSFIILDEIHIRKVETDSTLFYLKEFLKRNFNNKDCPFVILMSATLDPQIYLDFFECPDNAYLEVEGFSYPITTFWPKYTISDYINYAADLAKKIHLENLSDIKTNLRFRDILIFVQGTAQAKDISKKLHIFNATVLSKGIEYANNHIKELPSYLDDKFNNKVVGGSEVNNYLCPVIILSENIQRGDENYQNLYADISSIKVPIYEIKNNELGPLISREKCVRRVIIATNAIETGLTIDTLKYCIDTGFVIDVLFNPNFGCTVSLNKPVEKASVAQRKGRSGRKYKGEFYPLYVEDTFKKMETLPHPEIIKIDISQFMLDIIIAQTETTLEILQSNLVDEHAFQMNNYDQWWYKLEYKKELDFREIQFMQSPAYDSMSYSMEKLFTLGFIDAEYKPTIFGYIFSKIRKINIEHARMILAGYHHGANILDLITIVAFMQNSFKLGIKRNRYKPQNYLKTTDALTDYNYTTLIADEIIEYIFIYNEYMEQVEQSANNSDKNYLKWVEEKKINYETLTRIISIRDELITNFLTIGINPYYNGLGLKRGKYNLSNIMRGSITEGLEEIRKLKNCIYEGYRYNLFMWSNEKNSYISTYANYPLTIDKTKILKPLLYNTAIKQIRPKYLIATEVRLKYEVNGNISFNGSELSVLDGYVDIDLEFYNN